MAFYVGECHLEGGDSPDVNVVEVRFRGFKDDQGRKVAVLVRTKGKGGEGGEAVELQQELYWLRVMGGQTYR